MIHALLTEDITGDIIREFQFPLIMVITILIGTVHGIGIIGLTILTITAIIIPFIMVIIPDIIIITLTTIIIILHSISTGQYLMLRDCVIQAAEEVIA